MVYYGLAIAIYSVANLFWASGGGGGGGNLQFYPNFALFLTLGGMNLDQDFFQVSKLG